MGPWPETGTIDSMLCFHADGGQVLVCRLPNIFDPVPTSPVTAFIGTLAISSDFPTIHTLFVKHKSLRHNDHQVSLHSNLSGRVARSFEGLLRFGKTRIVPCYTLPASVTIDKDISKPRFPRRPVILNMHTDAADVSYITIYVSMQIR